MGESKAPGICKTVLLVEDDEAIRQVLQMMLEVEQFDVLVAANGQEALEILAKAPVRPCLILLDLMMPVMNGWEFVEAVNKVEAYASIPIVVITAFHDKVDTIKVNGFMLKPIEFDGFLKTVRQYCGT
ncbi:MAG: hypothetical protein A2X94_03560 [Bdellovibrionales bacterium GWB1_55_8]|nr:MAG: hypothetical protein A2X94_03560 [Bdellovibrionales bacterium GWB1_55_8]